MPFRFIYVVLADGQVRGIRRGHILIAIGRQRGMGRRMFE